MIGALPTYPTYRVSRLPWLGSVPSHWDEIRAKYLFAERDLRSESGQEELLSVSHITGVTPRSQKNISMFLAESNVGYKLCEPSDVVINTMWAWMAALGVARHSGMVSPSYAVYRPLGDCGLVPAFVDELLRTPAYAAEYLCSSTGINESRLRLYPERFLTIPILRPPADEQEAIVRFLKYADHRILSYIRSKQKLVRLLREQRQAIIHRAVTRGINPDVPLKSSGIEWLGEVPQHWQISRVKSELRTLNTRRVPLSATERGKMTRRIYDYYGASGVIDKVDSYLFDDDLLLIAEDGANLVLRNLPLAIIARGRFWVNNHAHVLKPRRGQLEYFAALLQCVDYSPWISGAAQPKLTQDRILSIRIPVPPASEQAEIVKWIQANTSELWTTIKTGERELALLRDYRARLTADVVTGKLDVREAAARLPGEPSLEGLEDETVVWAEEPDEAEQELAEAAE